MSKLDELIKELCPNGVEEKKLGEVIISLSTGLNPRSFFKLNTDDAKNYYVTIREMCNGDIVFTNRTDRINDEAIKLCNNRSNLEIGDVLFSGTGTIGETVVIYETPSNWNIKEGIYSIKPNSKSIDSKFLSHLLGSREMKKTYMKKIAGGTVKSIPMVELKKLKIPVPPLEVQREIVRILDSFTLLTAELTARKKQYEYYRDMLLVPPCDDVENISLSDVVSIKNGKDYKHLKDGKYPVYGSGGIMTYKSEYTYDKPSVLIPRKGSLSNLFYVEEPFWNVDTVFYTEINESKLIPKYLYYLLQKEHLESLNTAGGVPSLTQTVLNKLNLTIPSLNRQAKVVNCLDNFEKICNDLNIGLPAEIEARRKQYEYYRDVLLTFAETGSTILTDRQTDRQ